jgi:DNA photolyase
MLKISPRRVTLSDVRLSCAPTRPLAAFRVAGCVNSLVIARERPRLVCEVQTWPNCTTTSRLQVYVVEGGSMKPRTIIWFRSDLRLLDNAVVHLAQQNAAAGHDIIPVFFFDERFMCASNVLDRRPHCRKVGLPKMGGHRARFVHECVQHLKASLQQLGSDLFVYCKWPEQVLPGVQLDVWLPKVKVPWEAAC